MGRRGRDRMILDLQLQSVTITINVVSLNPAQARYTRFNSMWYNVCQWLAAGRWLTSGPPVSSINKTDRHDINEILLKVALNIVTQS
jgi:hypothetical protein